MSLKTRNLLIAIIIGMGAAIVCGITFFYINYFSNTLPDPKVNRIYFIDYLGKTVDDIELEFGSEYELNANVYGPNGFIYGGNAGMDYLSQESCEFIFASYPIEAELPDDYPLIRSGYIINSIILYNDLLINQDGLYADMSFEDIRKVCDKKGLSYNESDDSFHINYSSYAITYRFDSSRRQYAYIIALDDRADKSFKAAANAWEQFSQENSHSATTMSVFEYKLKVFSDWNDTKVPTDNIIRYWPKYEGVPVYYEGTVAYVRAADTSRFLIRTYSGFIIDCQADEGLPIMEGDRIFVMGEPVALSAYNTSDSNESHDTFLLNVSHYELSSSISGHDVDSFTDEEKEYFFNGYIYTCYDGDPSLYNKEIPAHTIQLTDSTINGYHYNCIEMKRNTYGIEFLMTLADPKVDTTQYRSFTLYYGNHEMRVSPATWHNWETQKRDCWPYRYELRSVVDETYLKALPYIPYDHGVEHAPLLFYH